MADSMVGALCTGVARRINFMSIAEDENIRGFLRIKPICTKNISDEIDAKSYLVDGNKFIAFTSTGRGEVHNEYSFNGILMPTNTQEDVFDLAVRDRLEDVLKGEDTLIFAYGTTSSGKSYTIQGKGTKPGIIPRALYIIFTSIGDNQELPGYLKPSNFNEATFLSKFEVDKAESEKLEMLLKSYQIVSQKASQSMEDSIRLTAFNEMEDILRNLEPIPIDTSDCKYSIWLSFIEVYNENIYDLFVDKSRPLRIHFNTDKNPYIKDVKYMNVTNWEEAYQLYVYGKQNLHVSSTSQNRNSSRSHCVLSVKIVRTFESSSEHEVVYTVSSFNICDLAGTERQRRTGNVGSRLKESQNINTSLLVLNRCFNIIRENQLKRPEDHQLVPFRESKLTLLFKNALVGGDCHTTMITNISQSGALTSETQQVLKATAVAMKIVAKPLVSNKRVPRRSVFHDLKSNPPNVPKIITSDFDEGISGVNNLECQSYFDLRSEIDRLKVLVDERNALLAEEKDNWAQRERGLRKELCDGFSKLLESKDNYYEERIERLKKDHKEEFNRVRKYWREYYECKIDEIRFLPDSSFVQMQNEMKFQEQLQPLNAEILELAKLIAIDCTDIPKADADYSLHETITLIEKITHAYLEDLAARKAKDTADANFIKSLEMRIKSLEDEIEKKSLMASKFLRMRERVTNHLLNNEMIFATDDISNEDMMGQNVDVMNCVDRLFENQAILANKLKEQENLFAQGAQDYAQLENLLKKSEEDKVKLEEDNVLKDHTINQLMNEIRNLTALLEVKHQKQEQTSDINNVIPAVGRSQLSDDREESLVCDEPIASVPRKSRRTRRTTQRRESGGHSDDNDPSFVMPKRKAVTSVKKRKPKSKKETDCMFGEYSDIQKNISSLASCSKLDVNVQEAIGTSTRRRRKLFLTESDTICDGGTILIEDLDVPQQSPNSYLSCQRPKK